MKSGNAIQSIWAYTVKNDFLHHFKDVYGPNGSWVKLFRRFPGYLKTELIRDLDDPFRFITVDYWESYTLFLSMKKNSSTEYASLDTLCGTYTSSEHHIGVFEVVGENEADP